MSLIERAVDRLGDPQAKPAVAPADPTALPVEQFIDRSASTPAPTVATVATAPAGPSVAARASAPSLAAVAAASPTATPAPTPLTREPVRIQLEAMRSRGMVTPDGEQTQIAQEFRVIKRPLIANAFGQGAASVRNGRRVMVTSAFPGEGKSFCAINLAMSIAIERDHQVLLIDADVARPSLPQELGIATDRGLMDWLVDGGPELSELVLPTNVERLSILPAGRRNKHATEMLASSAMSQLLDQLSASFPDRILVFDSPPLLLTTEARVLAGYMGQIVMVVEANRTPREAVQEALATIEGSEVIGLVLNKAREAGEASYGYGGYGYGYGYGGR